MKTEKATLAFGRRVFGVGVAALGMACVVFGEFDPGQMVPKNLPLTPRWPIPPVHSWS
jgi:hypothetical protein